jgi:glycosyltransferase involved in cell wall biosynthesis
MINVYYFFLGKKVLGLSNGIIATSMHYAKSSTILKTYIDKIQIVPPGVDRLYKGRKKISLAKYVLFVGQIDTTHSHKGLDYLVRAISLLRERCPDLKLIVIGKGNDISRYKLLSKTLGVRRKVVFKGFVAERRIISYYREALCLCLPSISNSEGFGMVILEAAAQHTPTIGCSVGGVPSVIINNKTGLLVRPKNAQQLADAIEKLYLSPKLALELGDEAYKQVVHRYQWYQQIDKTKHMLSRWEQNRSI